ncbi:hypothetical protein [Microbacterium sp. 3J1]|uniref:hypothetical protein n=1 Tax=Microbacterium sp. 3J1 TaxID=861269 RepID=UPI000A848F86|nr:hypothetical protein [Microbacterium sp. 3J1]
MDDERSEPHARSARDLPTPSLIQQRMALQRRRNWGAYTVVSCVLISSMWAVLVMLDGVDLWRLLGSALLLFGAVMGIREIRSASRATRVFEAKHGRDAGIQS